MYSHKQSFFFTIFLLFTGLLFTNAQIKSGVYNTAIENARHELKISDDYFVYSTYEINPAKFIKTVGGFYQVEEDKLVVLLEFNSDYQQDSIHILSIPFNASGENLTLNWFTELRLKRSNIHTQDLDGAWLFATRGPDKGQERRGEETARKTLKFLKDGHFQWIAYNMESLKFYGSGGGSYTAKDGIYTENITFFSKDNSRVGAELQFNYKLKSSDWHHTGKNSKGEPMYEIWAQRK